MTFLNGIDVSEANAGDYSDIQSLEFVIPRCSIGLSKDARWDQHSSYVLRHPPTRLFAYHFGDNRVDPVRQAVVALNVVGSKVHTLFLDREGSHDLSDSQASQVLAIWRKAGKIPGLYHSRSGYPNIGQAVNWVAEWDNTQPNIHWDFWQNHGAPLDRDYYSGTQAGLDTLAGLSTDKYILSVHDHVTPIYHTPNGVVIGHVSTASYIVQRYLITGHWWYKIISGSTGSYTSLRQNWIPAEPWETIRKIV